MGKIFIKLIGYIKMIIGGKKFYDISLTFRELKDGQRSVKVKLRFSGSKSVTLPCDLPADLQGEYLAWERYRGGKIVTYCFKKKDGEIYHHHEKIHTDLAKKLEEIVLSALETIN